MRGFHRTPALRIAAFILLSGFASGAADAACSEQDPLVSGMVGETSRVYLDGILRGLSGESPVVIDGEEFRIETRFSGSDGMELAASLLEQEFQNLGLEVRRHEYLGWFLEDVEFADSLSGWIVGDRGTILRTEDGGGHWVLQGDLDKHLYGLEVLTESRALIVAHGGTVYRTADGGRTWESTETGARRLRAISFVDSLNGWTCGDRGSAFRTRDGGVSWAPLDTRTAANLHATSFVDSMRGWMCGDNGYVLRTGDGGWNWEEFRAEDQPGFRAICFIDSQRGWVGGNGGTVLRTVDGGLSWSSVGVDTAVAIRDLEFWNPDRGWACGEEGFLFETRDGGASWDRSAPGAPADLSSLALRHGDGWMVGSYTLLRSRDLVDWEYQVSTVEGRWTNVEATLPGTVFPDVSYVICGHFDSISGIPSLRAPGADDNASGTALVVTAARALSGHCFEKTLRFVCFSGEEQGLRGSCSYVGDLLRSGDLPEGVINADMVAYDTGTEDQVWITTGDGADSRPLAEACSSMVWAYGLDLLPSITTTMYGASDHLSFSGAGVPAVMVSHADPTSYPYIHSVGDQYRLLNPQFAREVTRLAVAAAAVLAVPVDSGTGGENFRLRFSGVRPNPFSGAADIRYVVPDGDTHRVIMRLYDVRGRLVRTLVDGDRAPGAHDVRWDGADARGNSVSPGVFFVRLEVGGQTTATKLLRVE